MLSVENHEWFNKQSKEDQRRLNDSFQEYKRNFKLGIAEITTEGIKQAEVIELPTIEEDCIEIDLEPMTEEDLMKYEEYKRKRNEKVYDKFGYKKPMFMTAEQRRQQRELMEDLMLEIRY